MFSKIFSTGIFLNITLGCARLGITTRNPESPEGKKTQPAVNPRTSTSRTSRARTNVSDLKSLSKILEQAGRPLTETQIDYLLTLKPGPEFSEKMMEVLTDLQKEALSTGGRRRSR